MNSELNKLPVLAIDDEPLALQQLATYIEKVPFLQLCAQCHSALDAQQIMETTPIAAIFIDINMPDLNGLQFIRTLSNPPIIVLTTAYSEYAIEGYKVSAVDYLLKPFSFDEFYTAALKVKKEYEKTMTIYDNVNDNANENGNVNDNDNEDPLQGNQRSLFQAEQSRDELLSVCEKSNREGSSLFVKTEHRLVRIAIDNILYIEGLSEYVKIHFIDGQRPLTVLVSMRKMEEHLASPEGHGGFMRIHRSTIVNLNAITEVNKNRVVLLDKEYLPIGDLYRDALRRYLDSHTLSK
ncbi:MAG: response regulator transcription factor [Prevotella sp.]|nr:response regulator transcription factor [Prevotella sp.]